MKRKNIKKRNNTDKKVMVLLQRSIPKLLKEQREVVERDKMYSVLKKGLKHDFSKEQIEEITFHIADWYKDAAKVLAFVLNPDKFTPKEAEELFWDLKIHVWYHVLNITALGEMDEKELSNVRHVRKEIKAKYGNKSK